MIIEVVDNNIFDYDDEVLVPSTEIPEYLYTCTLYSKLDSIQEYGLGYKDKRKSHFGDHNSYSGIYSGEGFFLARDVDNAIAYYENYEYSDDDGLVVLLVPTKYLNKNKLYYDMNEESTLDYLNGESEYKHLVTYFYAGVIDDPQSKLEIMD